MCFFPYELYGYVHVFHLFFSLYLCCIICAVYFILFYGSYHLRLFNSIRICIWSFYLNFGLSTLLISSFMNAVVVVLIHRFSRFVHNLLYVSFYRYVFWCVIIELFTFFVLKSCLSFEWNVFENSLSHIEFEHYQELAYFKQFFFQSND